MMKKCGLYARVSTDLQANTRQGSLDTQLDTLRKFVDVKTASSDETWEVIQEYREEGKSGKDTDRPQYQRMLSDIRSGCVNAVLCTKIDRVSRSLMDFYGFHNLLEEYDITFISLGENWDTSSPMGRFALKITLAAAELEREQTAERTKEKMAWRAQQGLSNGGRVLGYDIDPDHPGIPTVNEEEKALVNLIYETYSREKSFQRVARIVNAKGYRTKSYISRRDRVQGGKRFADTTVAHILRNPYYIGKVYHKGELYEGQHKAIVSMDVFDRVQKVIRSNRVTNSRPRKQNLHVFLLQGLVRCGSCRAYMTPYYGYNHQKRPYFYYACTTSQHSGKEACDMRPAPAKPLEEAVADRLARLNDDPRLLKELLSQATENISDDLQDLSRTRDGLRSHRSRVKQQLQSLVQALAEGGTQLRSVSDRILDLEEQADQLDEEIREIGTEMAEKKKKAVSPDALKDTLTTFSELSSQATPEERKELMQLHINQLIWTPKGVKLALFERPADPLSPLTRPKKVQPVSATGSGGRARTYDMLVNSQPLCQLSYAGIGQKS